jgi:hypothetical protein
MTPTPSSWTCTASACAAPGEQGSEQGLLEQQLEELLQELLEKR